MTFMAVAKSDLCQVSQPPSRPWSLLYISKLRRLSPKVLWVGGRMSDVGWADHMTLSPVWCGDSTASTGSASSFRSETSELSGQKSFTFRFFFSSLRLCRFCCAPWGAHLCEGTAMKIANLWNLWCFIAVHSYLMLLDVTWFQYRNMFNLQTCSNTTHRNTSNLRSSAWGSPHI